MLDILLGDCNVFAERSRSMIAAVPERTVTDKSRSLVEATPIFKSGIRQLSGSLGGEGEYFGLVVVGSSAVFVDCTGFEAGNGG